MVAHEEDAPGLVTTSSREGVWGMVLVVDKDNEETRS